MRFDLALYRTLFLEFATANPTSFMDFYDEETLMCYSKHMVQDGVLTGGLTKAYAGNLSSSLRPTETGQRLAVLLKNDAKWQAAKLAIQSRGLSLDSATLLRELGDGESMGDDPQPIPGDEFEFRGDVHKVFRVDDVASGPPRKFVVVESDNSRWLIQAVTHGKPGPRFEAVQRLS